MSGLRGFLSLLLLWGSASAQPAWRIYLDADRTHATHGGDAIEWGLRLALHRVEGRLAGRPIELRCLDHRGNPRRSLRNLRQFLADERGLFVVTGIHSPPLLANRHFINANGILTLDPWAAAGPITRPEGDENWIFRLSVDDTKAGEVFVREVVRRKLERPYLLLEDTGWGDSNRATILHALKARSLSVSGESRFGWGMAKGRARGLLDDALNAGADCCVLVANTPEASAIVQAMDAMPAGRRLPLISHWGICGGRFFEGNERSLRGVDLVFLQTRFSFFPAGARPEVDALFESARSLFPARVRQRRDIRAPTGLAHAYDLLTLLAAASKKLELGDSAPENRRRLREALWNHNGEIRGLMKTYRRPFRPWSRHRGDAHEALGLEDLTLARYRRDGSIALLEGR